MSMRSPFYPDDDRDARRGVGIEAAWLDAREALPPDAEMVSLAVTTYMGSMPAEWEARASCERNGWTRSWVGRGSTAVAALSDLADFARKYPGE